MDARRGQLKRHTPSLADFITITCEFEFSVHTAGADEVFGTHRGAGDTWECLSGKPMSYHMFQERWPGLVSVEEYLGSFKHEDAADCP